MVLFKSEHQSIRRNNRAGRPAGPNRVWSRRSGPRCRAFLRRRFDISAGFSISSPEIRCIYGRAANGPCLRVTSPNIPRSLQMAVGAPQISGDGPSTWPVMSANARFTFQSGIVLNTRGSCILAAKAACARLSCRHERDARARTHAATCAHAQAQSLTRSPALSRSGPGASERSPARPMRRRGPIRRHGIRRSRCRPTAATKERQGVQAARLSSWASPQQASPRTLRRRLAGDEAGARRVRMRYGYDCAWLKTTICRPSRSPSCRSRREHHARSPSVPVTES